MEVVLQGLGNGLQFTLNPGLLVADGHEEAALHTLYDSAITPLEHRVSHGGALPAALAHTVGISQLHATERQTL